MAKVTLDVHKEGKMGRRVGASLHSGLVPVGGSWQGRAQSRSCGGEPAAGESWGQRVGLGAGEGAQEVCWSGWLWLLQWKTHALRNRARVQRKNLAGQMCVCSSRVCFLLRKLRPLGRDTDWGVQSAVLAEIPCHHGRSLALPKSCLNISVSYPPVPTLLSALAAWWQYWAEPKPRNPSLGQICVAWWVKRRRPSALSPTLQSHLCSREWSKSRNF